MFYGGCLWMRLLVTILILFISYHVPRETGLFIAICGAMAAAGNIYRIGQYGMDAVWWNRGVHAAFGLVLFVVGLLVYYNHLPWYIPGLVVLLNTFYGFVHSLLVHPFDKSIIRP